MIQRIQTIYLSLLVIMSLVLFSGSVFSCTDETGQVIKLMLSGDLTDKAGQPFAKVSPLWPVMVLLGLLTAGSVLAIILYNNRRLQMIVTAGIIVLAAGLITALCLYARTVSHSYKLTIHPGYKVVFPLLILVFSVLAFLSIRKDERLVRSLDRLR
jgi:hypothetical protein